MPADPALLLEVTNLLVSRLDLGDLFQALSDCIGRAVHHEYASISLFEKESGGAGAHVRLVVLDGGRRPDLEQRSIPISEGSARNFAQGKPAIYMIEDLERNNPEVARILVPIGMRAFCSVPMTTARAALGILSVASRRPDAFAAEQVGVLQQVSAQIAIAVENGIAYEEIRRLTNQLMSEKLYLEDEIRVDHGFGGIVGHAPALQRVLHQVETVASTDATVLLTGETGTGKELIARAIHDRSARKDRTFVRVNCAAIPSTLIESEMFGHERGAFTGAIATRVGRFEVAQGGTIFLDEVGDLPLEAQPKLLRVLQEREFERIGATRSVHVDVRVIAATNRALSTMVERREFRRDLYYRLNVFPIRLPPLRERREDIPALVRHFADKHARRIKRTVTNVPTDVMEALAAWEWPGNIRELDNVIERAVILSRDGVLRMPAAEIQDLTVPRREPRGRLIALEREAIVSALRDAGGVVGGPSGAAERLGLKRTTLQSRMRTLGIRRPSF
jgi:formate hydrogenlyase transcriptional activator